MLAKDAANLLRLGEAHGLRGRESLVEERAGERAVLGTAPGEVAAGDVSPGEEKLEGIAKPLENGEQLLLSNARGPR
ncbi:MAG: hypothetical protein QM820_10355 [Minicystis sp.]